jgi:hypothetical protein
MALEGTAPLLAVTAQAATLTGWTIRLSWHDRRIRRAAGQPARSRSTAPIEPWRELGALVSQLPPGSRVEHVGPGGETIRVTLAGNGC